MGKCKETCQFCTWLDDPICAYHCAYMDEEVLPQWNEDCLIEEPEEVKTEP